ncbi:MAG: relaxase/mobilization nuclease domain-containing protein [Hydrococcus sp. RU_2_2]|nr:relaxase/mobilization nuclease domain-containing protein [Hydrococcus sp. RU_2_2]
MIGKQVKGTSFRGVLNYLAAKEEAQLIGGNMVGKTPRFLAAEFKVARELNPNLKKAVYHASLSLPKTERLDNESWRAIASDYIKGMGFEGSQYVVYRHTDKQHDHIHIVASRIRLSDGTTVSDSWDYRRSETLIRDLEQKYQLTVAPSSDQKLERGQTTGEKRQTERTGEESIRLKLQEILVRATEKPTIMPQLIERLKNWGVDARVSFTREEKIKGISYSLDGIAISGTHLGKAYTFPGLQKHRGVIYEPSQEPEIRAASALKPDPQLIVLEKSSGGIDRTFEETHRVEENQQQQEQKPLSASSRLSIHPSSDESEQPYDLEAIAKRKPFYSRTTAMGIIQLFNFTPSARR